MNAQRRRLRIAYVYDALYPFLLGGGEKRFHELATRLAERHDVHSISWQFWDGPPDTTRDGLALHGVGRPEQMYGADGKRTVREALAFAARLMPAVRRGDFDVVDCAATPYPPLYTAWLATRLTKTRLVATWHEFWGDHWNTYLGHRGQLARVARWTEGGAVGLGDVQVAVSPFTADRLVAAGLARNRVRVVGNGIPRDAFTAARASLMASDVVFVGRLIEDKGIETLVDAIDRLRADFKAIRCLIIGDGTDRSRLEAKVAAQGLRGNVTFLGSVSESEKLSILKASRILALPSIREGFGIAAVEGQAAGLVPVVVRSPHSAAPGLIHDGVDGLVCDPTDAALASAIRSLLSDPLRLNLMRAAAAESAKRWDWDRVADDMEQVYLEVARPGGVGERSAAETVMAVIARRTRLGRFELSPISSIDPLLLLPAVLGGLALTVATTPLGGGDYGQWLMTARPYAGESIPDYRAAGAVPPLVPILLGSLMSVAGDAFVAIRLFTVFLLCVLGASAFFVGATLFRSARTGLVVTVLALLVVDQFLDLFAFGGLLQATAIALAWFAVAAFVRAADGPEREWVWWTLGAIGVGLIAMTHMGSAYIFVPTACAVAVLSARKVAAGRQARLRRLAPLGVALLAAMAFWLLVLLPDGTDLIQNPASLSYRGPSRLLESLTGYGPTAVVAVGGLVAIVAGSILEIRRALFGPWTILAAWTAITLAVALGAIITGAATDYPRFATPILAPLVIGAGAAVSIGIGFGSRWLSERTRTSQPRGWSVVVLTAIIVVSIPVAANRFLPEANGYRLQDAEALASAATWIDTNLEEGATILAPVREAKWIEGLTGRAALFSSPVRYSFRAEEWQRSLAAETLLRSNGALVNPFFLVRTTAAGADQSAARGVAIAANHGGEYVDLLATVPEHTRIVSVGADGLTMATLANLAPAGRDITFSGDEIQVVSSWAGERQGAAVAFRQALALKADSSVLDFSVTAETTLPVGGIELELRPPAPLEITTIDIVEQEATLSFTRLGSSEPRLRLVVVGGEGYIRPTASGGLIVRSLTPELRLLITDLSAGDTISALQWLDPADLVTAYSVDAVLLARGPSLEARRVRMEALGFSEARDFGTYLLLAR